MEANVIIKQLNEREPYDIQGEMQAEMKDIPGEMQSELQDIPGEMRSELQDIPGEMQGMQGVVQAGAVNLEQLHVEGHEILPEDILPSHEILRENLKRRTRFKKLFTEHKCRFCKKVFTDKSGLRHHEQIHNTERPFECTFCSYTAKTRKYLTRHISRNHKEKPRSYQCDQCSKKFLYACNLKQHQRTHTGEKPNKCQYCGKAFSALYSLKTHLLIHTNEKPYKCSFCDYACRDTSTLRKHHSTHLGLSMRYPCDECPRRFDTKARLREHVERVHLGIKYPKLICDMCQAELKTRASLISHIKTVHERANTCTCGVCGRALLSRSNLAQHMLVHVDMRPYKCTFKGCGMRFKDSYAVKKHAVKHYPDQHMVCQHCGRTFTRKHRLESHLIRYQVEGRCHSNNHKRFYKKVPRPKTAKTKAKSGPYICDTCSYRTNSRRKLIDHLNYGHGTDDDRECKICHKTFRQNKYLQLHYMNNHNLKYTTEINKKIPLKPMVHIKQEPPDLEVHVEMELLDIDKQEPFEEFEDKIFQYDLESWNRHEEESLGSVDKHSLNDERLITNEDLFSSEHGLNEIDLISGCKTDINKECAEKPNISEKSTCNVDEIVSLNQEYSSKCEVTSKDEETQNENVKETINNGGEGTSKDRDFSIFGCTRNSEKSAANNEETQNEIEERIINDGEEGTSKDREITRNREQSATNNEETHNEIENEIKNNGEEVTPRKTNTISEESAATNEVIHNEIGEEIINNEEGPSSGVDQRLSSKPQEIPLQENNMNDFNENTETTQEIAIENDADIALEVTKTEAAVSQDDPKNWSSRKAMPVGEFLQHIILAEQSDDEETDSQERLKRTIKELIQKSDVKNGIAPRRNILGRRLKRIDGDQVPDLIKKFFASKKTERTPPDDAEVAPQKSADAKERDKRAKKRRKRKGIGKRLKSKSKDGSKDDKQQKLNRDKDPRLNTNSMKLLFNMHQCYVCYKVFETKPELIEHCKQHFDVCNETTLKKCPFCPFVTHSKIKRHVKLKHKININFSFMRINDRKDNTNGSRYYFNIDNDEVKEMEVVPSVKILNKNACMELDRKNRERKDKSVLKRKLIRKGNEWVVEHEKMDLSKSIIPKLKGEENYLERLRLLHLEKKKLGQTILFPCNNCTKVCQNLSALTLHMRRHDPDAKPFKPKVWKHKRKNGNQKAKEKEDNNREVVLNTDNRTADPKPIVNNHKCDPKLMDFYKKNIKGGDVEFWQFLKIYNKMSKDNDFKDLDGLNAFGVEVKDSSADNNNVANIDDNKSDENDGKSGDKDVNSADTNADSTNKAVKVKKGVVNGKVSVKNKKNVLQRLGLTVEQFKKRCKVKAKMRRDIAIKSTV